MKKFNWGLVVKVLLVLLLAIGVVSLVGCGGGSSDEGSKSDSSGEAKETAEPITIKIAHQWPDATLEEGDFRSRLAKMFAKEVEERTNGSIKFEIYPAQSLVKAKEEYDALRKGSLDMAIWPVAYGSGKDPRFDITLMPAIVSSHEEAAKWKTSEIGAKIEEILAESNIKPLVWAWCAGGVGSKGKEIIEPSDVKGLKTRAAGKRCEEMLKNAGASITSMPSSEIYTAMQTGVLDAAVTSSSSFASYRLYEQVEYYLSPRNYTFWFMFEPLVISTHTWDKLTPEQQQVIMEVSEELEEFVFKATKEDDARVADLFAEKGVKVHDMTKEEYMKWKEAAKPVWENFAKEVEGGQELIDLAQKVTE